jgi:hypothetical protein
MLLLVCTLADIRNHSTITLLSIGCYPKARSMVSVVVILYVHHVARVRPNYKSGLDRHLNARLVGMREYNK